MNLFEKLVTMSLFVFVAGYVTSEVTICSHQVKARAERSVRGYANKLLGELGQ